ncbi:MAG: AmmeMemoRadiSam system protein B [Candidatus Lokiarchaeota archaeon]|nr:AmmeMemoRadiSam system protein B [Candidatus Harpocratesius repetitus]
MVLIRQPSAAGQFYARFKKELLNSIKKCFNDKYFGPGSALTVGNSPKDQQRKVIGAICPHAGYVYSGPAAAFSYQAVFKERLPDTIIILGTQHTGYYKIATMKQGKWKTPLGSIAIDNELVNDLLGSDSEIIEDDAAFNGFPHGREHNIEVQIPFIQYAALLAKREVKIVPIKIGNMNPIILEKVGETIAKAIQKNNSKDIAIIASSDMTHYQPRSPLTPKKEIDEVQVERDRKVISAFEKFDWDETYKYAKQTTVCGPQTIFTLMITASKLGYTQATALKYYNSFQKMGEHSPCDYSVGYFSGIIEK